MNYIYQRQWDIPWPVQSSSQLEMKLETGKEKEIERQSDSNLNKKTSGGYAGIHMQKKAEFSECSVGMY